MKRFRPDMTACFPLFLVLLLAGTIPAHAQGERKNSSDWRTPLHHLAGSWELTGTMGSIKLSQKCEAGWILQKQFFRMDCRAVPPDTTGYQAKYIIGYHTGKKRYLFHLFDTFGGSYSETIGRGVLSDSRIVFEFDYPQGAFQNMFVWNDTDQSWKMVLRQINEKGEWEQFSVKHLTRRD